MKKVIALDTISLDIIHISAKSENFYVGFSLISEETKQYKKTDCIILSDEFIRILATSKTTKLKLLLAISQTKTYEEAAAYMEASKRHFYRLMNDHYNECEELIKT